MGSKLSGDAAVSHLLRRAGFGLSPQDADEYRKLGFRGAVRRLLDELDTPPPADRGFDAYEPGAIQQTWLDRMVHHEAPLAEKLALFWHGHFATSDAKIQEPFLMWRQYLLFRTQGGRRFQPLVEKVSRDVAMIRWLDGNANRKGSANENYGRELQELFTLGIGNYTESDVREVARAFTGWGSRHHDFVFTEAFHDGEKKTFHGQTGAFGGDDVVRILTALPACRTFIANKLLRFFSHDEPTPAETAVIADVLAKTGGDIRSALFVLFQSPDFLDERRHRALVKSPVEFLVGALRTVGAPGTPLWVHGALERMGQILFRPPSVKGWPSGPAWLTSSSMVERVKAARRLAAAYPDAAKTIDAIEFDGTVPAALRSDLEGKSGPERTALIIASPEYQLA
ncbi:MAG: DUF1800 domain-containing protein [Planctomycetota bacterium]|nr:DUF1800 domain-containing protein [Planctomycetota bacterium]